MSLPSDSPFASERAERRIRLVTVTVSVVAVVMLVVGLYLLFFTGATLVGILLALVAVVDLTMVPFVARSMRRSAIERDVR